MAENTAISWTHHTWSPWEGCTKISPGCDHCYAEGMNKWLRKGENWGPGAPRREYSEAHWAKPLKWNEAAKAAGVRRRVFPSVCDPFDNAVAPEWRARFFDLIGRTPSLDWLLLTKRIGNAAGMIKEAVNAHWRADPAFWPWPNVWLGATIVNQEEADRDIPKLLATPALVRFLSMEPLLGPVDITPHLWGRPKACWDCPKDADCECGYLRRGFFTSDGKLDWVIVGGESGPGARPMHPEWARSLRDQCAAAGVPLHFKQWGEWFPAQSRPAETPGRFAFGDYEHDRAQFVQTDQYPRQFTRFGARCVMERVGKKAAGRLLDGVTHDGFPEVLA